MNIEELYLTMRPENALHEAGITTVEQLINLDWKELNSIKNIGKKSVSEICWECVQLLNGKMIERIMEYEKLRPSKPVNWQEMREKANKFDAISEIIRDDRKHYKR